MRLYTKRKAFPWNAFSFGSYYARLISPSRQQYIQDENTDSSLIRSFSISLKQRNPPIRIGGFLSFHLIHSRVWY